MDKSSYSDEEVKEILQALFLEKKKTRELDEKLQSLISKQKVTATAEPVSQQDDEVQKLKKLLILFKNKFEQAAEEISELKEKSTDSLKALPAPLTEEKADSIAEELNKTNQAMKELSKKLSDQLEKNVQLEKQLQTLEEENQSFKAQQVTLKQLLHSAQEDYRKTDYELTLALQKQKAVEAAKCEIEKKNQSLQAKIQEVMQASEKSVNKETQFKDLQYQIITLEGQNERQKTRLEKLASFLQEKERKIAELNQLHIRMQKTYQQKQEIQEELDRANDQCIHYKEEAEKLKTISEETTQHIQQLERANHHLQERTEETQSENNQLKSDLQTLEGTIASLNLQVRGLKEEKEFFSAELLSEKNLHSESLEEIAALRTQFDSLRKRIVMLQEEVKAQDVTLEEAKAKICDLNEAKAALEKKLEDKSSSFEDVEKEIELIKQALLKGLRETKEVEARYLDAVNEKVLVVNKFHQMQQQLEKQREEIHTLKTCLDEAIQNVQSKERASQQILHSQAAEHEASIKNLENELNLLKEQHQNQLNTQNETYITLEEKFRELEDLLKGRNEVIDRLNESIAALTQEKQNIQDSINTASRNLEEKDLQLKAIQQHLAKKVKDTSLLTEKNEEQKLLVAELQNALSHSKERVSELQSSLDAQSEQEKRIQEKLHEAVKSSEVQIAKWEEKYFQMYEKLQAADTKIKDLEKYEEKHKQMQALLSNLGNFMAPPAILQQQGISPVSEVREEPKARSQTQGSTTQEQNPSKTEKPQENPKNYQNLFDLPKSPRPKKDLLE